MSGLATRQRVYRIANGLEVDDIDHHEVSRRRVFFDDVVGVSHHRAVGWIFVVAMSILAGMFLSIAVLLIATAGVNGDGARMTGYTFAIIASPFVLAVMARIVLQIDVVTVYGRRTRAIMKFHFRKKRARAVLDEIIEAVRTEQSRLQLESQPEVAVSSSDPFAPPQSTTDS